LADGSADSSGVGGSSGASAGPQSSSSGVSSAGAASIGIANITDWAADVAGAPGVGSGAAGAAGVGSGAAGDAVTATGGGASSGGVGGGGAPGVDSGTENGSGGVAGGTSATEGAGDASANDVVTVSLVESPTEQAPGVVAVSVPQDIASSGKAFDFPLPTALAHVAAAGHVRVTSAGGKKLPSWLKYVPSSKSFVASTMPPGALPFDVSISAGGQSWTMQITERKGH